MLAPTRLHEYFTHCIKHSSVIADSVNRIAPIRMHGYLTHCGKHSTISARRIAPSRLREYFTHCVKHSSVCEARRGKLKSLIHIYVCSFIFFSFISYEWKALSTQK
ncbi:unnamed protein product [Bemisia tabaci]|uniref:Uncharacterized protein n=1 Tax=Bemisia tabaci TaxID=7038 RepID=A0A9P0AIB8_BEMTA|nr:unnamed protein product [Bemisia tabaci]